MDILERPMTTPAQHGYVPAKVVDAKTKALLAALTEQAPALGALLGKALRDGAISPDTVRALERASTALAADVTRLGSVVVALRQEADRVERAVTPPPPVAVTDWRLTRWAFFVGMAIGAVGIGWALLHG